MFTHMHDVTYTEIQLNHSKLCNFKRLRKRDKKDTIKLCKSFLLKFNKENPKETMEEMFCTFAGMTSLTLNSKLTNLITS